MAYDAYGFQQIFNVLVAVVVNGLTLIVMAAVMFSINWRLTLCALASAPLLLLTIKIWGKILADRSVEAKEIDSAMTTSLLDGLPGVGPARKRALLTHFGSPEAVVAATREDLQSVPGLPAKVGRELYAYLHRAG